MRAQGDIDLVILDVGLPSMDGFEVLRALRAQGGRMPVIMLTARSGTSDTVDGLDAGASDYVPKPFSVAELLARVRSRLRERTGAITMVLTHGDVTARPARAARRWRGAKSTCPRASSLSPSSSCGIRTGPHARAAAQPHLGHGLRSRVERRRRVRALPARQARRDHIVTVRGEGYRWE
jgi:DNA-binding response OmpR family regulator